MSDAGARARFASRIEELEDDVVAFCAELVRIDSQNPPGDTGPLVAAIEARLGDAPGVHARRIVAEDPAVNLVAMVSGSKPGRRLVFNGHLDTFPIGDTAGWSTPPLGGEIRDGRIYGRGACDMKAGIAASVTAFLLLAEFRGDWAGEAVLALVGDEETGGRWGTQHLLANFEETVGDAMISGDAGSPLVARIGEKGNLWVKVEAAGIANHGAHVHLGQNAIEALLDALTPVLALGDAPSQLPEAIARTIREAAPISEALSGAGESDTLQRITVNLGRIEGGLNINTIPNSAKALLDFRLPPGTAVADLHARIAAALDPLRDVTWEVLSECEPNWTEPDHELVRLVHDNARAVLGRDVAVNLRPGFSDARFYRQKGVPSVVYGVAANNMGGTDEFADIEELHAVFAVHALTAFDYLSA
ncbi:MAG: M20/M25/M40 family metallo-hydrolase [Alphaproteobacteria bacterium]|jgi:acetylornithine deacetylase/succinyl-diaminopimelate desuccinylase-like protein|nr:M20/M25/M40 family metallo-hydrolase [Alphaproteobacteria bacterium]